MTLNLLLTHQTPAEVAAMLAEWEKCAPREALFVAYGGPEQYFAAIAHPHKALITSPRLRTRDHQREKQGYCEVFAAALEWMQGRSFTHVHFAEYDHVPLVTDLNVRQIAFLEHEGADVLGFRLRRIDDASYPNYLYHAAEPRFHQHWESISVRKDRGVILRATGTGSFWTRSAFEGVAARPEPFPIYMELYIPTLAHHLGYCVRDWGAQNQFVHHLDEKTHALPSAAAEGAWTLHPVKRLWTQRAAEGSAQPTTAA